MVAEIQVLHGNAHSEVISYILNLMFSSARFIVILLQKNLR